MEAETCLILKIGRVCQFLLVQLENHFPGLPGITDYINYGETSSGGCLWCVDGYIPCLMLFGSRLGQLDDMVKQYLSNLHLYI